MIYLDGSVNDSHVSLISSSLLVCLSANNISVVVQESDGGNDNVTASIAYGK